MHCTVRRSQLLAYRFKAGRGGEGGLVNRPFTLSLSREGRGTLPLVAFWKV